MLVCVLDSNLEGWNVSGYLRAIYLSGFMIVFILFFNKNFVMKLPSLEPSIDLKMTDVMVKQ